MTTADPMFIVCGASKKKVRKLNKNVLQLNSDRNLKMSVYFCLF